MTAEGLRRACGGLAEGLRRACGMLKMSFGLSGRSSSREQLRGSLRKTVGARFEAQLNSNCWNIYFFLILFGTVLNVRGRKQKKTRWVCVCRSWYGFNRQWATKMQKRLRKYLKYYKMQFPEWFCSGGMLAECSRKAPLLIQDFCKRVPARCHIYTLYMYKYIYIYVYIHISTPVHIYTHV